MNIIKIALTTSMIFLVLPIMAQGAPPATPIDGGLGALLTLGTVYGIKKLRDTRGKRSS